ncbi:hypothetical protein FKM82_014098 [Ascaphus truei]
MEHSSRHLRFKVQSLGRRLDDLEEATRNLQKAEDEILDLQDKIIQAEGSNSSLLADVEALRKRVLKIEGKDEEVKKAEDLCRLLKEKLENEENVTRELRSEIEQLQKRMSELEKLEETFCKSKNDCTQLCLSLNEEKNLSKKLSTELEILRTRVKELEASESKLDKAEQFLEGELEKIKSLTLTFVNERKCSLEKEKQAEKLILELKQQLELKAKINTGDQSRNESNLLERSSDHVGLNNLRIEDDLPSRLSRKVGFNYMKQSENQPSSKSEYEKNKNQEDNKIKDLHQEIEKLKNQIKHFECIEEELKQCKENNRELQDTCFSEHSKSKQLADEVETLKSQAKPHQKVENGDVGEEINLHGRLNERTRYKGLSAEPTKYASRDASQLLRSERPRHRDPDSLYKRQLSNPSSRKTGKSAVLDTTIGSVRKLEDRPSSVASYLSSAKDFVAGQTDNKKSVLSRYPPAAQEQKAWKGSSAKKIEKPAQLFGEDYSAKVHQPVETSRKGEVSVSTKEKEVMANPSDANSEIKVNAAPQEDVELVGNCSSSSISNTQPNNAVSAAATAPDHPCTNILEDYSKTAVNSDESEVKENTSQDSRSSRYTHFSGSQDSITRSSIIEQTTKPAMPSKDEIDPLGQPDSDSKRLYTSRDKARFKSSTKPLIPEKPHIVEATDHTEGERRNITSGLQTKRHSSPRDKPRFRGDNRTSNFENDNYGIQREWVSEKSRKVSSDSLENMELGSHVEIRTRSCSPREALQSTVVIKPVIVEKDMKEVMGGYRARSSSELSKSPLHTVSNKVMSSITIYPSEAAPVRSSTEEPRERHTSTSNIRLSAKDQSSPTNMSLPFEISINKSDMSLKRTDANDDLDLEEKAKASNTSAAKKLEEEVTMSDNHTDVGPLSWKSHTAVDTNHTDDRPVTVRSWRRKGVLGSTEELDILTDKKDGSIDAKYIHTSFLDEKRPVRLRLREQYLRKTSTIVDNCSPPEFVSRRSQSSLSASEIISRRSLFNDPFLSSGFASWNRTTLEDFETLDIRSSRRKQLGSDRLAKTDSAARKQSAKLGLDRQHPRSMAEEQH